MSIIHRLFIDYLSIICQFSIDFLSIIFRLFIILIIIDYLSLFYGLFIDFLSITHRLFVDFLSNIYRFLSIIYRSSIDCDKFAFTRKNRKKSIIDENPSIKIQSMKTLAIQSIIQSIQNSAIDNRQVLLIGLDWQPWLLYMQHGYVMTLFYIGPAPLCSPRTVPSSGVLSRPWLPSYVSGMLCLRFHLPCISAAAIPVGQFEAEARFNPGEQASVPVSSLFLCNYSTLRYNILPRELNKYVLSEYTY